ncbi:hypothetical protein DLNHIDIE_03521 [Acidithiobacillus thiooxidans ATCC 19377]|uniref:Uncharacterized protein n=1 Tax=Acidithiobacillus thiooxidans ATCC 19377 TaxID=637390 RepID=A0A543PYL4_ACITH|nr:hypothetical protein DLNHIDIE_03521 [Acidithiobacillus thiooxidans ATCC 19377]
MERQIRTFKITHGQIGFIDRPGIHQAPRNSSVLGCPAMVQVLKELCGSFLGIEMKR